MRAKRCLTNLGLATLRVFQWWAFDRKLSRLTLRIIYLKFDLIAWGYGPQARDAW